VRQYGFPSRLPRYSELLREYEEWLEKLPDSIRMGGSTLVTKLESMGELDGAVGELEAADLPIGWGRD
jgi:hypothetical protein